MSRAGNLVLPLLLLVGCATPQERLEHQIASAAGVCRSVGFKDGTDGMRDCVARVYGAERARELEQTAGNSIIRGTTIVPPAPPTRGPMMCRAMGSLARC